LSHDEIVFEDVKYREPERRRRPDRDRRWACLAYEVAGPDDLPIFLDRMTADAIERHALRDTTVELGGILLGKECVDDETGEPFVWITQSLEAKHYENTQASFTYTHDSWEEITRERDRLHPDLDIVGWYHTHPDFGIFLSSHDLFIHRHFFAQRLQVAYVIDPIRQTRGFFRWRGDGLEQVGGYSIVADRGDRVALARLVNDLENLPNAEVGVGGLSPRLEAELIAMLTRPAPPHATITDRVQTAALFGLIGMLTGVLGLAVLIWLYTLNHRVQDQADALEELARTTEQATAAQRLALDTLLDESSDVRARRSIAKYDQTVRELAALKRKLSDEATIQDALAAQAGKLQKELADAKKVVREYETLKKEYPDLATRIRVLESEREASAAKLAEYDKLLETTEGRNATALLNKYHRTWYAAVAGWVVGVFAAFSLLFTLGRQKPVTEPGGSAPEPEEPPPHRIT
jgi:proteasome lid subunit RPN8/RPN11